MAAKRIYGTAEERFWPKVARGTPDACWPWLGYVGARGYGSFNLGPTRIEPHRFAYLSTIGPVPDGLVLDHLCRNPRCCNPFHLEPVTDRVNTLLRGMGAKAVAHRNGTCTRGHHKTNFVRKADGTVAYCRICRNARRRATNWGRP